MAETQPWTILKLSSQDPGFKKYAPFVYQTWLRTYRRFNLHIREIPEKIYFESYARVLQNLFTRPDVMIHLAVTTDDFDVILGWACIENEKLHYVFTKTDCGARLKGIGRSLVPKNTTLVTHLTSFGRAILKKHKTITYNPFGVL